MQASKDNVDFKETIESLSRVLNIAEKAENASEINPALFENEHEKKLYENFLLLKGKFEKQLGISDQFAALASLQPAISGYFDHTMVMADTEEIKRNRLAQMKNLAEIIGSFAAMNEIQVK